MKRVKSFIQYSDTTITRDLLQEIARDISDGSMRVEFSDHFLKQVNLREITGKESVRSILASLCRQHRDFLDSLSPGITEAVVHDIKTQINVPVVLRKTASKRITVIAKTIVQKDHFETLDPILNVLSGEQTNETFTSRRNRNFFASFCECMH